MEEGSVFSYKKCLSRNIRNARTHLDAGIGFLLMCEYCHCFAFVTGAHSERSKETDTKLHLKRATALRWGYCSIQVSSLPERKPQKIKGNRRISPGKFLKE